MIQVGIRMGYDLANRNDPSSPHYRAFEALWDSAVIQSLSFVQFQKAASSKSAIYVGDDPSDNILNFPYSFEVPPDLMSLWSISDLDSNRVLTLSDANSAGFDKIFLLENSFLFTFRKNISLNGIFQDTNFFRQAPPHFYEVLIAYLSVKLAPIFGYIDKIPNLMQEFQFTLKMAQDQEARIQSSGDSSLFSPHSSQKPSFTAVDPWNGVHL